MTSLRSRGLLLASVCFLGVLGMIEAGPFGRRGPAVIQSPAYIDPYVPAYAPPVVGPHGGLPAYSGQASPAPAYPHMAPVPAYPPPIHPYTAPLPGYGILPPPLATYQMIYGFDPYAGGRQTNAYANATDQLDYTPRKRPELYPAIPFGKGPASEVDVRRARFEIAVPTPNAIVLFDGAKTKQTGLNRVFVTPPLVEDKLYSSTIEVEWTDEAGTKLRRKKTFDFVAGERLEHRFSD